jgi:hypothetical protein
LTVKLWHLGTLLCLGIGGCSGSGARDGMEPAARTFFNVEFQKWIGGHENQVATMQSRTRNLKRPISYDVRSVVPEKPDPLAFDRIHGLPEDWEYWPAWRFNVAIEWESQAGTPLQKVTTYRLTWNSHEKRWYVAERFE